MESFKKFGPPSSGDRFVFKGRHLNWCISHTQNQRVWKRSKKDTTAGNMIEERNVWVIIRHLCESVSRQKQRGLQNKACHQLDTHSSTRTARLCAVTVDGEWSKDCRAWPAGPEWAEQYHAAEGCNTISCYLVSWSLGWSGTNCERGILTKTDIHQVHNNWRKTEERQQDTWPNQAVSWKHTAARRWPHPPLVAAVVWYN